MLYYNHRRGKKENRKEVKKMTIWTEATNEEVKVYNKVEAVVKEMTDEEFENFVEVISLRVFDYKSDKAIYNKAYRLAKKFGLTLNEAETWYCIDEA